MNLRITLTVLLNLGIYLATGAQSFPGRKIASAHALGDLQMVRLSVARLHPGFGRFGPRSEFLQPLDSLKAALEKSDSVSVESFFRMLNPILVRLRCGHTKFFPPMKLFPFYFNTDHVLPVIVRFEDTGRLLVIRSAHPETVGQYLESIQGRPILSILQELRRQMLVDGHVQSSADAQIQQYFSAWYADFIQQGDRALTVGLTDQNGKATCMLMEGITAAAWQALDKNSSYLTHHNHLRFGNDSVAYLRIANFYSHEGDKHFRRFLDSAFTAISQRPVGHLVIDVRGNEGGNDALGKTLFAHIARRDFRYYDHIEVKVKRKKELPDRGRAYLPKFIGLARLFIKKDVQGRLVFKKHQNLGMHRPRQGAYQGNVSFLQDGLSYSVTSEFLAVARSEDRGTFIGEESGGTYEGDNSGTFVIYKLAGTGLDLGIPLAGYYSAVKPVPSPGRGILPDITVRPGREDLLSGRDPIRAALSYGSSILLNF